jgi:hypothetical protein
VAAIDATYGEKKLEIQKMLIVFAKQLNLDLFIWRWYGFIP